MLPWGKDHLLNSRFVIAVVAEMHGNEELDALSSSDHLCRIRLPFLKESIPISPSQVLSKNDISGLIGLADKYNLVLLADEVYQENVYDPNKEFFSFREVMHEMGVQVQLASYHSISKRLILRLFPACIMRNLDLPPLEGL